MDTPARTTAARPPEALGRVAYLAYWRVLGPLAIPWDTLSQREQRAWQAAARAAIKAARAKQPRAVTVTVTDTDTPHPPARRRKRQTAAD
jgi:hypothetical protein